MNTVMKKSNDFSIVTYLICWIGVFTMRAILAVAQVELTPQAEPQLWTPCDDLPMLVRDVYI